VKASSLPFPPTRTPNYALLYHSLQDFCPVRTTGILVLKLTTFYPNMTENSTAADHQVGGCFYLFDKLEFVTPSN
jgi:hypothetical protein